MLCNIDITIFSPELRCLNLINVRSILARFDNGCA
jgi:hypothetical protein